MPKATVNPNIIKLKVELNQKDVEALLKAFNYAYFFLWGDSKKKKELKKLNAERLKSDEKEIDKLAGMFYNLKDLNWGKDDSFCDF